MQILFLSDNFPPEVNAPASRTYEHCRAWAAAGHKITVITCAPNFPTGKVFAGYRNKLWQRSDMDGIDIIRVWSFVTANEGFAKRILDYVSFMVSAFIAGLFVRRPDIIVGTSPQFFTVVATYLLGAVKRRPWVFELRDIWPESIKAVGAMKDSFAIRFLERLEMHLYRNADRIVAVTQSFRKTLIARGIAADKIEVVTNGVDLSFYSPRQKDQELCLQHNLSGQFVVGYLGTHGMAHALETLIDAASVIQNDPAGKHIRFLFIGNGARKAFLIEKAIEQGLGNVLFLDTVEKQHVASHWSILDASIVHLRKTPLFETVIPSKIFEAMGMGMPILMGVAGEAGGIVAQGQVGLAFEAENAEDLAKAILKLSNDPALCESYRENALQFAKQYDRGYLAEQMLSILKEIVCQSRIAKR